MDRSRQYYTAHISAAKFLIAVLTLRYCAEGSAIETAWLSHGKVDETPDDAQRKDLETRS
jgi:hypothetical protein